MSTYFALLTALGEAKLANAAALGGTLKLTHMGVGDADDQAPTPDRAQTMLRNERRRAPLNRLTVDPANPSQIIVEQVLPENVGGWWIREIGVYDEEGMLCAVANCPPSYKPQLSEGSGRTQVVRMVLLVSSSSTVELKIDPAVVLATRGYVEECTLARVAEHGAATDPHPGYLLKTDNLSGIADPAAARAHVGAVDGAFVSAAINAATEPLVARLQLPMLNLYRDSGRFFDIDAPANAGVRRITSLSGAGFYAGQISLLNGTTVANAGQFIHDNSNFGGTQGAMSASVVSLINTMGRKSKRYGVEFYIAEYFALLNNPTEYPVSLPAGQAWLSCVNSANTQGAISSMYWIRVIHGQIETGDGEVCYRNGKEASSIVNPEDGWVHICNVENWGGGYTMSSHIFATPGTRYQMALPAMVLGDMHGAIHQAPILGFDY